MNNKNIKNRLKHLALTMMIFAGFALLIPGDVIAATGGPDTFGYTFADSDEAGHRFNWIEIAPPEGGAGIEIISLNGVDDGYYHAVTMPFNFNFYGTNYTELEIGSNGIVYFVNSYLGAINTSIPANNAYGINTHISHYWDDLHVGTGHVYYLVDSEKVVIEYYKVKRLSLLDSQTCTWQVILFADGNIKMQYLDAAFGDVNYDYAKEATIGIQTSFTTGLLYSYNTASLKDNFSICFKHPDSTSDACDAQVPTLDSWKWVIAMILVAISMAMLPIKRR